MSGLTRRDLMFAAAAPAARLNYVVVLADDLGYGDVGCYGSTQNRTPHLDRLAADGLRFTHHYSCAPVCSPARAGLLTGLAPHRTGVTGVLREEHDNGGGLRTGLRTMADVFREKGCRTALLGKWHLGMDDAHRPERFGFDYFWGFTSGTIDYMTHVSRGGGGRGSAVTFDGGRPFRGEGYFPDLLTDRVADYVESHRAEPYFLLVSNPLPHVPLQAPDRWTGPFRGSMPAKHATYAGMVACLDACVGRLRDSLEKTGQWDRTVVVFLSDNGWVKKVTPDVAPVGSNGPLRGGKYELYEGGLRSPCIVRWPGLTRAGAMSAEPGWFLDWMETFTGAATRDGRSLRAAMAGRRGSERTFHWRFADEQVKTPASFAVRRGRWKLLDIGGESRLFDLEADPGESRDVAAAHPREAAALRRSFERWSAALSRETR